MTLQQEYIEALLNPLLFHSPADNAAKDEILWLRSQLSEGSVKESWNAPLPKKAEKVGEVAKKGK